MDFQTAISWEMYDQRPPTVVRTVSRMNFSYTWVYYRLCWDGTKMMVSSWICSSIYQLGCWLNPRWSLHTVALSATVIFEAWYKSSIKIEFWTFHYGVGQTSLNTSSDPYHLHDSSAFACFFWPSFYRRKLSHGYRHSIYIRPCSAIGYPKLFCWLWAEKLGVPYRGARP